MLSRKGIGLIKLSVAIAWCVLLLLLLLVAPAAMERNYGGGGGRYPYENGVVMTRDPKPRLRWTADLHDRFVDAVTKLGGPDSTFSS